MKSKSSLFLIELIISTLFFALSATVCVQMFVKAHLVNNSNVALDHATLWVQNLGDSWLSDPTQGEDFSSYLENLGVTETSDPAKSGAMVIYLDQDWLPCDASECSFTSTLTSSEDDSFYYATVTIRGLDQNGSAMTILEQDFISYKRMSPADEGGASHE